MDDEETTPRRPSGFGLRDLQPAEAGAFVRELDDAVRIKDLGTKVDGLLGAMDRQAAKMEKLEEKFETRLGNVTERVMTNNQEFERTLTALQLSVQRHEAQLAVLMRLHESNWTGQLLTLLENKEVRAGLLLLFGWLASEVGPAVLAAVLKALE